MKKMKIISICLIILTLLFMGSTICYAESSNDSGILFYTVYNETGKIVKTGKIASKNAAYHWSPNITLKNGWYTSFTKPGPKSFKVSKGTSMKLSYKLNRSAKIKYHYSKGSTSTPVEAKSWKTGYKTAKESSVTKTADKTAYYFTGILCQSKMLYRQV